MAVSTWTTASAPSQVVGIPGYWYEVSAGSLRGSAVRIGPFATATLMSSFPSAVRRRNTHVGAGYGTAGRDAAVARGITGSASAAGSAERRTTDTAGRPPVGTRSA